MSETDQKNLAWVNANNLIYVRLTKAGKKHYSDHIKQNQYLINRGVKTDAEEDSQGYTRFSLWSFMKIFGDVYAVGAHQPTMEGRIYFNQADLVMDNKYSERWILSVTTAVTAVAYAQPNLLISIAVIIVAPLAMIFALACGEAVRIATRDTWQLWRAKKSLKMLHAVESKLHSLRDINQKLEADQVFKEELIQRLKGIRTELSKVKRHNKQLQSELDKK